ncbi:MAG: hypothetical protein ACHP8B_07600 [Terriglobales bacterium]
MTQVIGVMKSRLQDIISALKAHLLADASYKRSMRQSLARKPFLKTDGRYISREEVHSRSSQR